MPDEEREIPQTPKEWVHEAFHRMQEEISCCEDHFNDEDFQSIVIHMTNVAYGCKVTAEMICEKILSNEQVIELLHHKLEEAFGQPMEYVGRSGEFEGFKMVPIEVPDDARELDE